MSTRSALLYNTEEDEDYFYPTSIERPQYKSSKSRGAVASIRQKCSFRSRSSSYTSIRDEKMYTDDLVSSPATSMLLSDDYSTFKKLVFLQSTKKEQKVATENKSPFEIDEEQEVYNNESVLYEKKQSIYSRRAVDSQPSWKSSLMRAVGGLKNRRASNSDT